MTSQNPAAASDSSKKHEYQCSPMIPTPRIVIEQRRRKRQKEEEELKKKRASLLRKRRLSGKLSSQSSLPTITSVASMSSSSGQQVVQVPISSTVTAEDETNKKEPYAISALYGLINVTIILPVLMSFGTIIYKDKAFEEYLPVLVKLTVLSGAVHQICFSIFSSLPFAVGQVQDAGLIFLSAMAGTIVNYCQSTSSTSNPYDPVEEHILATTTVLLPLSTAILGIGLILIGQANLASYVQLLPTPVVGGYLAFIGFFCGQSGLALMANVQVAGIFEWKKFLQPDALLHLLPGLLFGFIIYILVKTIRHMAVLPVCIASLIVAFYVVLFLTSSSIQEARENGWILQNSHPPPIWYKTWDYLKFNKVEWGVIPQLIPTLISMILVVALSSSLDVAAIELEIGRPLDYDHELKTVGLSNVMSGLTGGYTGSYIFSQSIFSLRSGIRRRLNGAVIAVCEIIIFLLPFSVLDYVPIFFFGSLLVMIAIDLTCEWLWEVRDKMTFVEYIINVSTFCLIHGLGVEYGILAGLTLYAVCKKLGMDVGTIEETEEEQLKNNSESAQLLRSSSLDGGSMTMLSKGYNGLDYDADDTTRSRRGIEATHATLMI